MTTFLRVRAWALAALGGLSGCGRATGSVTGRVLFRGRPLPGGRIIFVIGPGRRLSAEINKDGTYALTGLPPGALRVALDPTSVPLSGQGQGKREGQPLPARYRDPDRSGLRAAIRPGRQQLDFNLHWNPVRRP
jgi:hypothetical protein